MALRMFSTEARASADVFVCIWAIFAARLATGVSISSSTNLCDRWSWRQSSRGKDGERNDGLVGRVVASNQGKRVCSYISNTWGG